MKFWDVVIIVLVLFPFIYLFIRLRIKRSGTTAGLFITSYGATDAFFHHEQKQAIETIANTNAHKKMEEQSSADDKDKNAKNDH
jgi:hypothetical protein